MRAAGLAGVLALAACQTPPPPPPPPPPPLFPALWTTVDVTRPLDRDAPYLSHRKSYPFERIAVRATPERPWRTGKFSALEHQGTHVIAPRTRNPEGATMDAFPAAGLALEAVVLDAPPGTADADAVLSVADVQAHEKRWGPIPGGALVLLRTGRGAVQAADAAYRGKKSKGGGPSFPGLSVDVVKYLAAQRSVAALGTDTLALDAGDRLDAAPAQAAACVAGLWSIVNLGDLAALPPRGTRVVVAPLPIRDAAGAPARIVAFVPPDDRLPTPVKPPVKSRAPQ